MTSRVLRVLLIEDTASRQRVLTQLVKDHAWVLVHTGRRAIRLLGSYTFDLIFLDYDLADRVRGDAVAQAVRDSLNAEATVIVHTMNSRGAERIKTVLPRAQLVPLSRFIRNNETFKRLRGELVRESPIDWDHVFRGGREIHGPGETGRRS